ncbi:MAG: 3-hydroxyacyl-CoA dehydrogenase [Oxalobacteraceae bacterium]|nr:3-hydroxyacyl-CoA dehydrogenase [Oxalobacteraceae bacterium]
MSQGLTKDSLIGVVGSGAMGTGIAQVAAVAGHRVMLFDARDGAAQAACDAIRKTLTTLVEKGRMPSDQASAAAARLHAASSFNEFKPAFLVVEAIVENLEAKQQLFASLEAVVAPDCVLATNTSSISITSIGANLLHPARLVGMHFFNPVPLMALVEVISGLATSSAVADCIEATAKDWGKLPVRATSTPGFIVNRVARPFYAEALRLLLEQAADPASIDAVMRDAGGFRMGPFELMDLIGHDVNFAVTQSVFEAYHNDPRFTPSVLQKELLNAGFLGRKSGRGFFAYGPDVPAPKPQQHADSAYSGKPSFNRHAPAAVAIATRLAAAGHEFDWHESVGDNKPLITLHGASLYLTDGRSATMRASESGQADTVLIDLALAMDTCTRLAVAVADQCSSVGQTSLVGVLQAAGYRVTMLRDVPGMVVMRTVAMLANEAADAVNQGVCSAADANLAMQKGVNYPLGPLAWAERVGLELIQRVLQNVGAEYGEDRYRISPLIRRKVAAGTTF